MINGQFEVSSSSGTALSLPVVLFAAPTAMVVVSSNE
jgi:hypothetical protein